MFLLNMIRKILTLHIFSLISLGIYLEDGYFKSFPGLRIRNAFSSVTMFSGERLRCCLTCLSKSGCYGVNMHKEDGVCEINLLGPGGYGDLTDKNQSWTAYFRLNGK
jgi:hypothetical protein